MCKHCKNLTEDRQITHDFAERAAQRINEKWQKENAHASPITADDLDIKISVVQVRGSVYRILEEMNK